MTNLTSENLTPWFIVLYEWQGAHDLTDCRDWYPSAEILSEAVAANHVIERYRKSEQPRRGRLTYRNIRGPFPWSEPTQ